MPAQPYIVTLKPKRLLLNPKFEGYKLKLFDDRNRLQHFPLPPPGITISRFSSSKLSYKEIRNRIHYNHLFLGYEIIDRKKIFFYFDKELYISMVEYDQTSNFIITYRLINIPQFLGDQMHTEARDASPSNLEYPSLKALSSTLLLITNGSGTIFIVKILSDESNGYYGEIIHQTDINVCSEGESEDNDRFNRVPFVILDGKIVGEGDNAHILFSIYYTVPKQENSNIDNLPKNDSRKTLFDISLLKMSLDHPYNIQILHTLRGNEIPLYYNIDIHGDGYVIGSNEEYDIIKRSSAQEFEVDELDEQDNVAESTQDVGVKEAKSNNDDKMAPYIWTQTSTDLTICFQLPPGTPKTAVHCNFTKTHLSLTINIDSSTSNTNLLPQSPIPCYAFTPLFDLIDPSSSLWTIEPKIGLLTLHLEKHHHKTRWSHVFQQDDGVFETIDPNEFAEFRERLEKYTAELNDSTGNTVGHQGILDALRHPIGHEMEESVDFEEHAATIMWIDLNGKIGAKTSAGGHEFISRQFESFDEQKLTDDVSPMPSICLKLDVDGLVYTISHPSKPLESNASPLIMDHTATFNAFAFVQASKREKNFVFHDPNNRFVMILEGKHHAYVYWHSEDRVKHNEQFVVDFSEKIGKDTNIIGVQMISSKEAMIMVLASDSVIIIKLM
ncbi:tumor antigen cml66-l [Gigaspora margarita]|uniref:NudC domain-containing protein 1 n=1 Tax=Gigaspora margarita TaxID=4874 RepID=A0A8H4A8X6_GIGMA|nr:tumor antigen cml66-l [Gigaspora margarita]